MKPKKSKWKFKQTNLTLLNTNQKDKHPNLFVPALFHAVLSRDVLTSSTTTIPNDKCQIRSDLNVCIIYFSHFSKHQTDPLTLLRHCFDILFFCFAYTWFLYRQKHVPIFLFRPLNIRWSIIDELFQPLVRRRHAYHFHLSYFLICFRFICLNACLDFLTARLVLLYYYYHDK